MMSPPGVFLTLFLLGLTAALVGMGYAALRRPAPPPWISGPALAAGAYILVPIVVFVVLLARQPHDPLTILATVYGRGIYLDPAIGTGVWTVVWVVLLFGPTTAVIVHIAHEYPDRVDHYVNAVLVYLVVLVVLVLYGLHFRTAGEPLYLGDPSWSIRGDDWIHSLYQVPFGVAAYTIGQAAYYRARRLVAWLLVLWSPVVLQGLLLVWYTFTVVERGGAW